MDNFTECGLGRLRPHDFAKWLCSECKILDVSFEDRVFELTERRVDILYKIRTEDVGEFLLHLEFQVELKARFSTRMHEYATRIYREHELPVKTVAIFLSCSPAIQELVPVDRWELGGELISEFHYTKVILPEKGWKTILAQKIPALLPLIPLAHIPNGEEQQALSETARSIEKLLDDKLKGELAAIFYLIGGYHYPKFVRKVIGDRLMQDLMQSATYREAVEAGKVEGEIKGFLKALSWISADLAKKYENEVKAVKTEEELEKIEERIKKELEAR